MKKLRIVLTGADGQLGRAICQVAGAKFPELEVLPLGQADLDVREQGALEEVLQRKPSFLPSILINCAAYTAVDQAESEDDEAYAVNSFAPGYLALSCSMLDMMMIHISTDYVFDGASNQPYTEEDKPTPLSVYGETKAVGEENVHRLLGLRGLVVRTAWLYSAEGSNFVAKMLELSYLRESIRIVDDQLGSPTYAPHLAEALICIALLAQERGYFPVQTVHYTNRGHCSWYTLASEAIALMGNAHCSVLPISTEEYPTLAKRPKYSILSLEGLRKHFGIVPPTWQEGLQELKKILENKHKV